MTEQLDPQIDMMNAAAELAAAVGWTGLFTAYLGRGDGAATLRDLSAQYPRAVWCHVRGQQPFSAVLDVACGIPWAENPRLIGKAVQCGYPPNSRVLHVRGQVGLEALLATGGQTVQDQLIHAASMTAPHNILPFRLSPTAPASTAVFIAPGWYYQPSTGDLKFFGGDTIDFAADIAALSAGEHQLAVACFDRETGLPDAVLGAAETGTAKGAFDQGTLDALTIDPTWLPSGAVHLYAGQTAIVEADHYRGAMDARVLFAGPITNTLTVSEIDASPNVSGVSALRLNNGVLADDGGGQVTLYSPGEALFTFSGDLTVGASPMRIYNVLGGSRTITRVFCYANTAPTGAAVLVDVHKNGTTIFTTQSNRPSIAAGANTGNATTIEVPAWAADEYLECYVDQIGSSIPGANLVVHVAYR